MSIRKIVERKTKETTIRVEVCIGRGRAAIDTTVPFLDHMMTALAKYSGVDMTISARGDLRHHIVEDVALTVGEAIAAILPAGAARYGERTVPMDDAVVQAVLDAGGRPFYRGPIPSSFFEHWMRSFCDAAKFTLHIRVLRGEDRHHVVEAAFKALGFALSDALQDTGSVFSTKGSVVGKTRTKKRHGV
ncbi:MAG TPA: imidazoleglycerol-phosphate dehydratase [Casimicrobiaceae bacterium]